MTCNSCNPRPLRGLPDPTPAQRGMQQRNAAVLAHVAAVHRTTRGVWQVTLRRSVTVTPQPGETPWAAARAAVGDLADLLDDVEPVDDLPPGEGGTWLAHLTYVVNVTACEDTYDDEAVRAMHDDGYEPTGFTIDHDHTYLGRDY